MTFEQLQMQKVITQSGVLNKNWRKCIDPESEQFQKLLKTLDARSIGEAVWFAKNHCYPKCLGCDSRPIFSRGVWGKFCSLQCAQKSELTKEIRKNTVKQKFGVEHVAQHSEIKQKMARTVLRKYGNSPEHYFGGSKFKSKMVKLYGVDNPARSKEIMQCQKNTWHTRFTERILPQLQKAGFQPVESLISSTKQYLFKCTGCSALVEKRVWKEVNPRCPVCTPYSISLHHAKLRDWLIAKNENVEVNDRRVIKPLELDLYLPDRKLALEINGVYWHSELMGMQKDYHRNKTALCMAKGITLIHLYEDDLDLNFSDIAQRLEKDYLDIAPDFDIQIDEVLFVDGNWPLPQQFSARLIGMLEPKMKKIQKKFESRVQSPVWDAGTLVYAPKDNVC